MRKLLLVAVSLLCILSAYPQQAKLILPIGHTKDVNWAEFNKNATKIVTASDDKTAKIWDAETGLLLASLKGHKDNVLAATFSADGNRILTYSDDGTAILWNAGTGLRINSMLNKAEGIMYAVFSKDGSKILTASTDSSITVWEGVSGQLLSSTKNPDGELSSVAFNPDATMVVTITSHKSEARIWGINGAQLAVKYRVDAHGRELYNAAFSPDGRNLLTVALDSTIKVWDYTAGTSRNFKLKDDIVYAGFSPDNRKLVTVTTHNVVKLYNAVKAPNQPDSYVYIKMLDGKDGDISAIEFSPDSKKMVTSHDQVARVWDVESKDSLPILSIPFGFGVNRVKFNNNGSRLVTALADKIADVWDANTGDFLLSLDGHTSATTSERFSPDGTKIVTSGEDGLARIWDAQTGEFKILLSGHKDVINSAEFSADGKRIVTASDDSVTKVWDAVTGRLLANLKGHRAEVNYAQFSPDGLRIITASADSTSLLWRLDAVTKKWTFVKRLAGHNGMVRTALFSPDGLTVLTVSKDKDQIKIWDGNTGAPKGIITETMTIDLSGLGKNIKSVSFSPDSKIIITGSGGMSVTASKGPQLWDATDGHPVASPVIHDHSTPEFVMYNPNGQRILSVSKDNYALTVDAKTFQSPVVLQGIPENELVMDAMYSPDGGKIILSFTDNTAKVWDAATGQKIASLTGHNDDVVSARFSPDGKYVLTGSDDNTLKKWETGKWQLLYTFFPVDSVDYLVLDKFNRWDGSPAARALLYVTCGLEVINLEQFEDLGWEPGLIKKVLGLNPEPIKAKKLSEINLCNYTPVVTQMGFSNGTYQYQITARIGGVNDIQLYVNDKLVKLYMPASLPNTAPNVYQLSVKQSEVQPYFSSGQANRVSVIATTADRTMTSRGGVGINTEVTAKKLTNPTLYLISIGINDYAGAKMKLNYASTDAVSFSSAVTASAKKLLGADHVKTFTFSTETGSTNWPSKELIKKAVESIAQTATADDILVFFFAGHGKVPEGQKNFYLLTAGSTSFNLDPGENKEAISTDELNVWMRNIKAHKQVLILDACQSGQAIENLQSLVARGDEIPADQVRALEHLKDNAGTFILSASSSSQSAYENPEYGQGLLTYSLLSGIKNQDALTSNKFIDISKWFNTAKANVSDMAKASKKIQEPQIIGAASYSVGLVDQEIINGIRLAGRKKIVARTTLSEANNRFDRDNLRLSSEVDNQLGQQSALGVASPFSFIETNSGNDAYSVTGKYEVKGNAVNVTAALFLGSKDAPEIEISKTGTVDNKAALAKSIVEAVTQYLRSK